MNYTRYADDITFSTDAASFHTSIVEGYDDWLRVVELGKGLRKVIAEANFSINFKIFDRDFSIDFFFFDREIPIKIF